MDVHADRIARYLAAYEAANGKRPDFAVEYEGGWYRFKRGFFQKGCYRADKIDSMIALLKFRVSDDFKAFRTRTMILPPTGA